MSLIDLQRAVPRRWTGSTASWRLPSVPGLVIMELIQDAKIHNRCSKL